MTGTDILNAFRHAAENFENSAEWQAAIEEAYQKNKWFTPENTTQALSQWLVSLSPDNMSNWEGTILNSDFNGKIAGIIMAGNVPFVGIHDLLCCLVCGYQVQVKTSSDDEVLPKHWAKMATKLLPELSDRISFSDMVKGTDVVVATGSNNSAQHFEYYFRNIPHLLRRNRNSVAVLTGNETAEQLTALGHDVFDYFGLGCRNITHLFLPEGFEFRPLFEAWEVFADVANHNKYVNNYHYHKALLLMNLDPHLDTGFLLVKERNDIYSPVGMLNYSFYSKPEEVLQTLEHNKDNIQCVVSADTRFSEIPLGASQKTMLWDYADGANTIQWLQSAIPIT